MDKVFLTNIDLAFNSIRNVVIDPLASYPSSPIAGQIVFRTSDNIHYGYDGTVWHSLYGAGSSGTVSTVSVVSANGFAGTVANATTAPAITLSTTVTGMLKGDGTTISAATPGTDYASATNGTNGQLLVSDGSGGFGTALTVSTDGTFAANSDSNIPTQKAVKTYVDTIATSAMHFKGTINASTNPNYPAATIGDMYVISAAGKIGGASGVSVDVGDAVVAIATNAGGTQASVGSSWDVIEHNISGALLAANNLSDLTSASAARTNLGLGAIATLGIGSGLSSSGGNLVIDTSVVPSKYSATIGDGSSTSISVTHNLGTQDIIASIRDASTNAVVICDVVATSTTQATFSFTVAPASNSLRVTIIG